MNRKRRLSAILLSLAMVITYMPAFAFAADETVIAADQEQTEEVSEQETIDASAEAIGVGTGEETADNTDNAAEIADNSEEAAASADSTEQAEIAETPENADAVQDSEDTSADAEPEMEKRKLDFNIGSSDDLLLQYFEVEFNDGKTPQQSGMLKARKVPRRNNLSENGKAIYDVILAQVKLIADGSKKEPTATYDYSMLGEDDDIYEIIYAMVSDYPYEFYWFDKTDWLWAGYGKVTFPVASEYRGELLNEDEGIYALDTSKLSAAKASAENARSIVDECSLYNDYSKLIRYRNVICNLVDYNYDAAYSDVPYGDPWQMIYVFDEDTSTNVVCEGYSKAFQFLCDNTDFESDEIECFTVTGWMGSGLAEVEDDQDVLGNHMWNVLHMEDGNNYMADVTNSDYDSVGANGSLFLAAPLPYTSYRVNRFDCDDDGEPDITYAYERDTLDLFSETELTLAVSGYPGGDLHKHTPSAEPDPMLLEEATCTDEGVYADVTYCTECGEIIDYEIVYTPANGHTEVTVAGKASTCTEKGLSDGVKCSVCDEWIRKQQDIPATGHTKFTIHGYAATCTEDGLSDGSKCSVCGEMIEEQVVIPALGHEWNEGEITIIPTPTDDGIRTYTCTRCGETREEIIPAGNYELTEENTVISAGNAVYTGSARRPAVTVTVDGSVLTEGEDFEVAYSNNISAGTGIITVTGTGMYSGEVTKNFAIAKRAITPAVTLSTVNYTWNNAVKTPGVTVKDGTKVLKKGTDYSVTYQAGRKNIGRYNVTVTLKGNYSGKKTVTFNINPKPCTIKAPTKAKKAFTAKWKKMATKMPKAAITGYQVQYSTNKTFKTGAKTVTVKGVKKVSRKISGLKAKTTYYVRVRTYISVGGRYYYSTWSSVKSAKTK